jgi:hypothetical protein
VRWSEYEGDDSRGCKDSYSRLEEKRKKTAEAWMAIIQRVEDSQLTHMCDQDPTIIWAELAHVHASCSLATHLALHRKFLALVKADKKGMAAWIGWIMGLRYKLEDIGVKVNVEDMILALMMGLDTSYDSFIISLDSAPVDKLTLEHVVDQLLNKEVQRDNKQEAEKGGNEKAAKHQVYR